MWVDYCEEGECQVGGGGGRGGEGERPDPVSLPGHDTDWGLCPKDDWESLKGNEQGNDLIVLVLYKKNLGCSVAGVLQGALVMWEIIYEIM